MCWDVMREGLLFTPTATETADTEEAMITGSMADQTKEKIKDASQVLEPFS